MPRILFPVIFIISSVAAWGAPLHLMKLDELLARFDRAVECRMEMIDAREKTVSDLKHKLGAASPAESRAIARAIAEEYCTLQLDSALAYFYIAADGADGEQAEYCRGQICRLLPLKGRTAEALELYHGIHPDTADISSMVMYHRAGEGMYINMRCIRSGQRYPQRSAAKPSPRAGCVAQPVIGHLLPQQPQAHL